MFLMSQITSQKIPFFNYSLDINTNSDENSATIFTTKYIKMNKLNIINVKLVLNLTVLKYTLFVERQIKALKIIFGPKTWCTKKPFSYRIAHQRRVLTGFLFPVNP